MREPAITARVALHERLTTPAQILDTVPQATMPPYMESFLAHLRLLVGVPFEYLVPDERLLPPESIRFFYVDRSWTDRVVDGAAAVGQIGSREQAHYQAHSSAVTTQLDQSERMVRRLQRKNDFLSAKAEVDAHPRPGEVVTGFLLRSSVVAGWPHLDVRAYRSPVKEPYDTSSSAVMAQQMKALRIERLAPSLLLALFEGEPQMVILEEPHHGVQFGIRKDNSRVSVPLRDGRGNQIRVNDDAVPVTVPMRAGRGDVVRIAALRDRLQQQRPAHPTAVDQTGAAAFAISVLDPPWRQHFEGTEDHGLDQPANRRTFVMVTDTIRRATLKVSIETILNREA